MSLQSSRPFFVFDLLIQESYSSSAFAFLHSVDLGFDKQMHAFFALTFLALFSQSANCFCGVASAGAGAGADESADGSADQDS
jgi:hypothetical protein